MLVLHHGSEQCMHAVGMKHIPSKRHVTNIKLVFSFGRFQNLLFSLQSVVYLAAVLCAFKAHQKYLEA